MQALPSVPLSETPAVTTEVLIRNVEDSNLKQPKPDPGSREIHMPRSLKTKISIVILQQ